MRRVADLTWRYLSRSARCWSMNASAVMKIRIPAMIGKIAGMSSPKGPMNPRPSGFPIEDGDIFCMFSAIGFMLIVFSKLFLFDNNALFPHAYSLPPIYQVLNPQVWSMADPTSSKLQHALKSFWLQSWI